MAEYPFLITGFARSGTKYMSEVFRALGYDVMHEAYAKDGVVSYRHLPYHENFKVVLHQTRHPLDVLSSCFTLENTTFQRVIDYTHIQPQIPEEKVLKRHMWAWARWCAECDKVCKARYKVEDFDIIYPEVFKLLGLPIPKELPDIKKSVNSRKTDSRYRPLSWKDLEKADWGLTNEIMAMSCYYGYKD
jgi:hypothetical protein